MSALNSDLVSTVGPVGLSATDLGRSAAFHPADAPGTDAPTHGLL